jgi:hypothetical protein
MELLVQLVDKQRLKQEQLHSRVDYLCVRPSPSIMWPRAQCCEARGEAGFNNTGVREHRLRGLSHTAASQLRAVRTAVLVRRSQGWTWTLASSHVQAALIQAANVLCAKEALATAALGIGIFHRLRVVQ